MFKNGGLSKSIDRIVVWCGHCGAFLPFLAMLIINYDVVSRYLFNRPSLWAYDVSRYMLLYTTLLLGGWVLREDGHVKIDLFVNRLGERPKIIVETISSFLIIAICIILFYQGIKSTAEDFISGRKTNDVIEIDRFWLMMSIPIGSLLLICQGVRKFKLNLDKFSAVRNKHESNTK